MARDGGDGLDAHIPSAHPFAVSAKCTRTAQALHGAMSTGSVLCCQLLGVCSKKEADVCSCAQQIPNLGQCCLVQLCGFSCNLLQSISCCAQLMAVLFLLSAA